MVYDQRTSEENKIRVSSHYFTQVSKVSFQLNRAIPVFINTSRVLTFDDTDWNFDPQFDYIQNKVSGTILKITMR